MTNLIQLIKSTTSVLAVCLLASVMEIAECGMKGNKGGGSDIILYKDNLLIRGNGKGQGNLVIAGKQHGHHGHHGHHEEFHGGHHEFGEHHGSHKHSKEQNFILAVIRDGDKGKGNKGGKGKGGGNNMGGGGGGGKGGKGKGGGGSTIVMGNMGGGMSQKGSDEMNWEELILGGGGGGKY